MEIDKLQSLSPRAEEYYKQTFMPRYAALQKVVDQVPLAILVWGPGEGVSDLYSKRLQIRNELRQQGHAAFFSEELDGNTPCSTSLKGIEFLQAQAADLIVVMQTSYGSIAEVHDFAEHRVIHSKMMIFVDQDATDGYSYRGALTELEELYNNVHTFKYPDDIIQCNLLTKVLERVNLLQMVKYRAMQNAKAWGLIP